MLRLLADENVPKRLVRLLVERGVDVVRVQDLGLRGIGDWELVEVANRLGRAVLTRDADFASPRVLSRARGGVVYISFQPSKGELPLLADRIADLLRRLKLRPGLLVVVEREYVEVYQ